MKSTMKITGIMLMLVMAGSLSLNAQRGGMRGMRMDSTRMGMMRQNYDTMQRHMMRPMGQGMRQMQGYRQRFAPQAQFGMQRGGMYAHQANFGRRGMRQGMGMMYGHGRNVGRMPVNRMGWDNMRPGRPMIESIPNITEKQKKDLADLRLKNQEELKKFREETAAKMQTIRDAHKAKMMNLLTDEQKRAVDPEFGKKVTPPATKK